MHTIRLDKTAKSGTYINKRLCNLDCIWCHNDYFEHNGFIAISNEDFISAINRIINAASFSAVQIRIAGGGEPPLVGVSELSDLIYQIKQIPQVSDIKLTTNGILLGKYIKSLKASGLDSVTVSLNSLNQDVYKKYSQRDKLFQVLESLETVYSIGIKLKINTIYWTGNENELLKYESLSIKYDGLPIKFFDLIPNSESGLQYYLPLSKLEKQLQKWGINYIDEIEPYYQRIYQFPSGAVFIVKKSSDTNNCPNKLCKFRDICVEGCRHSIRIGMDGILKPCGVRRDNEINLFQNGVTNYDIWQALYSGGKVGY